MSSSLLQLHSVHAESVSSPLPAANLDLRACHSRAQEISDIEGAFFRLADYRYRAIAESPPKAPRQPGKQSRHATDQGFEAPVVWAEGCHVGLNPCCRISTVVGGVTKRKSRPAKRSRPIGAA